jgi:DNA-binding NtrC family response regulator
MSIPSQPLALSTMPALVVDDEDGVRELLAEHLSAKGIPVTAVSDGAAAIEAIARQSGRFGLVFADLHLPKSDGMAVLEAARAANSSAYVVIITGYATLDSAIRAVRLGAYDYLTKPFSLGQIDVILRRIEDRISLESENRRLLHRIDTREGESAHGVRERLTAVEARLAGIESLLRDLTAEVMRRRG